MFLLLFIDKYILSFDVRASSFDMEQGMSITQAGFGAVVAATLVLTPGTMTSRQAEDPFAALHQVSSAVLAEGRLCRDVVLETTLDATGEVIAFVKQL